MSENNRNSYKNPPDTVYDTWKNELEIWRRVTDLDADNQALAITLSLTGRARERAVKIPAEFLDSDRGVDVLICEFDDVFKKETKYATYEAYSGFGNFRKTNKTVCGLHSVNEFATPSMSPPLRHFNDCRYDAVNCFDGCGASHANSSRHLKLKLTQENSSFGANTFAWIEIGSEYSHSEINGNVKGGKLSFVLENKSKVDGMELLFLKKHLPRHDEEETKTRGLN
ncbi:hypothetical protein LOTGIDRAFT_158401 [Lottia gigantea]|uniref:Uncharacterized protein n=1 Tax=Lottia gigantea TaxID=225164 RepID=V4AW46_LOTGI|nr:hypothetical protein LOTGIDRAFT_158401 [Lottia gigantea]ESO99320.1 hypothetical protein LOTGIDRAFT_158401 [Lottia gigantea]